jgi:hypothetical protein
MGPYSRGGGAARAVLVSATLFAFVGCGGRVITRDSVSDGGEHPTSNPAVTKTADAGTSASPSGSSSDRGLDGTVILPECRLGFAPGDDPQKPCHYVVAGACYDTKTKACACACKKQSGTDCISGFPQYNGHVSVSCN